MAESHASVFSHARSLGGRALVYGLGTVFLRGITFFLLPVYTRYLSREDYGMLAVILTITTILGIIFPLGLHGCLTRQHYDTADPEERRVRLGTLAWAILGFALTLALLVEIAGKPVIELLFRKVSFVPYVRLAIWTAVCNSLSLLPLNLLQIQERPGRYVLLSSVGSLTSIGAILYFVVVRRQGPYGYLLGTFLGAAVLLLPSSMVLFRHARCSIRWDILRPALAYSLPLLPHGLAAWVLSLSDRVILERYVPLGDVGLYLLAYQIASILTLFASALNTAWVPFLFRVHAEQGDAGRPLLARLTTYMILSMTWVALGLALMGKAAVLLLTAPAFHAAHPLVPWMSAGFLLNALYLIPVSFLFLVSKTVWIPLGTLGAGLTSIGLNLALVPTQGVLAAAWTCVASNFVLLVLISFASARSSRLPYEYRRVAHLLIIAAVLGGLGLLLSLRSPLLEGGLRAALWAGFPLVLLATGFSTSSERDRLRFTLAKVFRRGGASS